MHGSPLLRSVLMIVALLLTAFPLWNLTHKSEPRIAATTVVPSVKTKVHIDLTFVHPPTQFQLLQFGKTIWEKQSPGTKEGKEFEMEFPKEGIDLEIKAQWPSGTDVSAVRVAITQGNQESIEKSAWGRATLDEVLTFHESN